MDITLHLIIAPANHPLDGMEDACRYRAGDILDVYRATKYATLQPDGNYIMNKHPGHPRFGFVHIKNVPDNLDKEKIKAALISEAAKPSSILRRRKWHIPPSILPTTFKQKLLSDKQATVEFSAAKAYIRKKFIMVELDPDQDNIATELSDEDIS